MSTQTFSRAEHRRVKAEFRAANTTVPIHRVREAMQRLAASNSPRDAAMLARWRAGQLSVVGVRADGIVFQWAKR